MFSDFSSAVIALCMIIIVYFWFFKAFGVKKLFKLPIYYIYIGGDIAGDRKPFFIDKKGIRGAPDAVFFNIFKFRYVVCEFKSRAFNGRSTLREQYQLCLYAYLVPPATLFPCDSYFAYGCGRVVKYDRDRAVFDGLLGLREEVKQVKKNWNLTDPRPLHVRAKS